MLSNKAKKVIKKWSATLLTLALMISLTACNKQEQKPATSPPNEIAEEKYEGKIKEARDYLIQQGLSPAKAATKEMDGNETIITWKDLCDNDESIILNAFLNQTISETSSNHNYGPVYLRSVIFVLIDEKTAAEVYFYENKIIGGVTYPKDEITRETKEYRSLSGETLAQIRQIDYPVWQAGQDSTGEPAIYYLQAEQALKDGFERAIRIQNLDQGRILIIFRNDIESRVYVYDMKDASDFYTGISSGEDYLAIRVKQLENNRTAVLLSHKMLIVDRESFKVLEEIKYPEEELSIDDLEISPDGKTIVYAAREGLTVYDSNFKNGKVIVASKIGKDPHGMDWEVPRYPILSPDSSRILYRLCGYEWLVGTGTIALDGSDHKYFKADSEEKTFIQWYDNNQIYSNGPAYGDWRNPLLHNIQTDEERYLIQDAPKDKRIDYLLGKNNKLYYQETEMNESGALNFLKFGYYDIGKKTWNQLIESPKLHQINLDSTAYDPEESAFAFIVSNSPLSFKPAILVGLN